eukprot:168971-Karenia_brevis.AAC.1
MSAPSAVEMAALKLIMSSGRHMPLHLESLCVCTSLSGSNYAVISNSPLRDALCKNALRL